MPQIHLQGGRESGPQLVPPNSVTPIPCVISLALATCSHHPVMWAAGIINPSHELILPPNTSGRIEAPPPPPLQERKKWLQLSQAFPSLKECQRHTPAIIMTPSCTTYVYLSCMASQKKQRDLGAGPTLLLMRSAALSKPMMLSEP